MNISMEPNSKKPKLEGEYSSPERVQGPLSIISLDIFGNITSYLEPRNHLAVSLVNKNYFKLVKEKLFIDTLYPYSTFFSIIRKDLNINSPKVIFTQEIMARGQLFLKNFLGFSEDFSLNKIEEEIKNLPLKTLVDLRRLNTITNKFNEFIGLFLATLDGEHIKQDLENKFKNSISFDLSIEKMLKIREIAGPLKDASKVNAIFEDLSYLASPTLKIFSSLDCWHSIAQVIKKAYHNVKTNENIVNYQEEIDALLMNVLECFFNKYLLNNDIKTALNFFESEQNYFLATVFNSIIVGYEELLNKKEYNLLQKETNFAELKYIYEKLIQFLDKLTNEEKWEFNVQYLGATWCRILTVYAKIGDKKTFYSLLPYLTTNATVDGECCIDEEGSLIRAKENLRQKQEVWSFLLEYDLAHAEVNDFYEDIIKMTREHALYERDYHDYDYEIPNSIDLYPIFEWILTDDSIQKNNIYGKPFYIKYLFPLARKLVDKQDFVKAIDILKCLIKCVDYQKSLSTDSSDNEKYEKLNKKFMKILFILGSNMFNSNAKISELSKLFHEIKQINLLNCF
jgi:hypothetical protein